ncbi:hypothetical protein JCM4914_27310 [Streptomyces platensis subsp. malvinus]
MARVSDVEFPGRAWQAILLGGGQVADAQSAGVGNELGDLRCLILGRLCGEEGQVGRPLGGLCGAGAAGDWHSARPAAGGEFCGDRREDGILVPGRAGE